MTCAQESKSCIINTVRLNLNFILNYGIARNLAAPQPTPLKLQPNANQSMFTVTWSSDGKKEYARALERVLDRVYAGQNALDYQMVAPEFFTHLSSNKR